MKLEILPLTAEAMHRCGWSCARKVNIEATRVMLESLGYFVGSVAEEILTSLTGLTISFSNGLGISFNADETDRIFSKSKDEATLLSSIIGEPVCRIGAMTLSDLFVTKTGKIVILDIEWTQVSIVHNIDQYLDSMANWSENSWRTLQIPLKQRPSPLNQPPPPGLSINRK